MTATRPLVMLLAVSVSAGCATREPAPRPTGSVESTARTLPDDPVPRKEPRSRYGNGPVYEVNGKRYRVLESSFGYRERGVASWYGRKFHGRPTSSQEPYDMYRMTAAHKSLPLPTYVEVRNLRNGRVVVVRVNDRGPFVKNRLIDLSYAAALKLGIVDEGTGMVEVRAISFDPPPAAAAARPALQESPPPAESPGVTPPPQPAPQAGSAERDDEAPRIYVQVGAFGERANAERRHRLLTSNGIEPAFVLREANRTPAMYRVRIGPLASVEHYDRLVDELSSIGIAEAHIVTD